MLKKILNNIEEVLVIAALGIMCVTLALQVIFRYIFNAPLVWSEELARYLFVWITFLGAGYGVKYHLHIEMEALYNTFPKTVQKIVQVFVNLMAIGLYSYVIPSGITFTMGQHGIASTTMGIPMSFVYAAAPVGCLFLVIRLIIDTIKIFTVKEADGKKVTVQ